MKSTTFILLLLLLGTTTWIHGEEEEEPCNTCSNTDTPTSGPIMIEIGNSKEEPRSPPPPPSKTACNPDESMWFYGLILCNYKDCCEHCRSKWAFYERSGRVFSKQDCISVPELVRMLERYRYTETELYWKDNLNDPDWLYR